MQKDLRYDSIESIENYSSICLTDREKQVLSWVSKGKSNSSISTIMSISHSTVDFHMKNIFKKLGVNNRVLVALMVIEHHLLE
jgi:DNA-binding CsgD family transcriptional regulator